MSEEKKAPTYMCVAGHVIPSGQLDDLTAVISIDRGAEVLICIEHGSPIAVEFPADSQVRRDTLPKDRVQ